MSLINQMLKDLERRKGGGGTEPLSAGIRVVAGGGRSRLGWGDRKSTRLNSSHT